MLRHLFYIIAVSCLWLQPFYFPISEETNKENNILYLWLWNDRRHQSHLADLECCNLEAELDA